MASLLAEDSPAPLSPLTTASISARFLSCGGRGAPAGGCGGGGLVRGTTKPSIEGVRKRRRGGGLIFSAEVQVQVGHIGGIAGAWLVAEARWPSFHRPSVTHAHGWAQSGRGLRLLSGTTTNGSLPCLPSVPGAVCNMTPSRCRYVRVLVKPGRVQNMKWSLHNDSPLI